MLIFCQNDQLFKAQAIQYIIMDYNSKILCTDSIVRGTIDDFLKRAELGKEKYGRLPTAPQRGAYGWCALPQQVHSNAEKQSIKVLISIYCYLTAYAN